MKHDCILFYVREHATTFFSRSDEINDDHPNCENTHLIFTHHFSLRSFRSGSQSVNYTILRTLGSVSIQLTNMSGYRSLHREQILETAVWSVATSPLLSTATTGSAGESSTKSVAAATAGSSSTPWRIWTASADGLVRGYIVTESSIETKQNMLDASALRLDCTHALLGTGQDYPVATQAVLGCTVVSLTRNYVGDDRQAGDLVVISLELGGKVRVWSFTEDMDDKGGGPAAAEGNFKQVRALFEFEVANATGTTLQVCPPALSGVGDVAVAVGCLDGTISIVATGLATPGAKKDPTPAGTVLDTWGSRGSAVPLSLCWHPVTSHTLAVGRQDGVVDILTATKKNQHRLTQHSTPVRGLAFTDDGNLLMAGSDEQLMCIWDVSRKTPTLVHHVLQAHKSWFLDISPLTDSRRFVTVGADRTLHVWNVGQLYQPLHTFQVDQSVYSVQRGPAGLPRLVTGSDTGWLQVFSLES
jgi:WD40 repeat protein